MRALVACLVLCAPAIAGALDLDGTYLLATDGDCAAIGKEGGALKIEKGVFIGIESQCEMRNPVNVRDMDAQLFDMTCSDGGTQWVERALMMRSATGGLILVWNGFAFAYDSCTASDTKTENEPLQ